ncbi:MAG: metalloregulator ArsR/SmtB family transcription factor [Pirellulales bacterium]
METMITTATPPVKSSGSGESSSSRAKVSSSSAKGKPVVSPLDDQTTHDLVQLFKLLADETRVRILHYLLQSEEINVRSLCQLLEQSQPAVSHHLALLRQAGLIQCRREGKHNFYHLVPNRFSGYADLIALATANSGKAIGLIDSAKQAAAPQ